MLELHASEKLHWWCCYDKEQLMGHCDVGPTGLSWHIGTYEISWRSLQNHLRKCSSYFSFFSYLSQSRSQNFNVLPLMSNWYRLMWHWMMFLNPILLLFYHYPFSDIQVDVLQSMSNRHQLVVVCRWIMAHWIMGPFIRQWWVRPSVRNISSQ